jgi:hypothetical protein
MGRQVILIIVIIKGDAAIAVCSASATIHASDAIPRIVEGILFNHFVSPVKN